MGPFAKRLKNEFKGGVTPVALKPEPEMKYGVAPELEYTMVPVVIVMGSAEAMAGHINAAPRTRSEMLALMSVWFTEVIALSAAGKYLFG